MNTAVLLATPAAILALVNLCKGLGLSGKFSAIVAIVLGVAFSVADYYLATYGAYQAAVSGLILGLGAAGLYDAARSAGATLSVRAVQPSVVESTDPITIVDGEV